MLNRKPRPGGYGRIAISTMDLLARRAARCGDFAYWDALTQRDGQWYPQIAQDGYSYDPKRMSSMVLPDA